ncbi:golgin subfamily B member 1-like isoform X2 [Belonocnema kinseyi]|nr:golgin subfamily B member 1-like isoform X2 [Belonocnema kinseyi]
MSGNPEEPPGPAEGGPDEPLDLKESCEQSKSQLVTLKELMIRNKQSLKKKEEEIQEYAKKLSKFKTRAKLSRKGKEEASGESTAKSETALLEAEDVVDDISQAKTPKAKSSLLQRKLAEDKKIFEQRSKVMTENKRAVEEKVEAIRQQLEERDQQTLPPNPVSQAAPLMQMSFQQDKDNKIAELSNRILELEATVLDLRENLKEKDSVIDSKTKAITLMSADLSMKGKTTLDTLEDTKDEMRTMQEHFVLLESSLRSKNDNLLEQLREKSDRITDLEDTLQRSADQLEAQKVAESASVDFSRSTMDTLADTKEAMKSMQENFVLIESSLKSKNDHLLKQLEERETRLAEAMERIFNLESGAGISRVPEIAELEYKIEKVEENSRKLQDEKYELQKNNSELQNQVIALESATNGNGLIVEKDNRIAELESLIEELKKSNQLLQEESKTELQKQLAELSVRNEEISNRLVDLERMVHDLETERAELAAKIPSESPKEDEKVVKLTKELEDLNRGVIKMRAQNKSKVKNLQRQLESFRKVSDANAELVRLGNQVALLEEEKGNLQLGLVDFDELKASAGDWKEQIADLEGKVNAQAKEIQAHIEAIAALENQKLDLMQELHSIKQEISTLEAENAESENLRVTAEMKIVDLEEQLESFNRIQNDQKPNDSSVDLIQKIESLTRENEELHQEISKLKEKGSSDAGSTESFETLHETDRSELLKKIEEINQRNSDLMKKLSTLEEKTEEKGSSDTGSTESFEKIPGHSDNSMKIEMLTRENNELVIKLTKLEEKLEAESSKESEESERIQRLVHENNELVIEITKLKERVSDDSQLRIKSLMEDNEDLKRKLEQLGTRLEKDQDSLEHSQRLEQLSQEKEALLERVSILEEMDSQEKSDLREAESATIASLESEIESCKRLIQEQKNTMDDLKLKLIDKEEELERKIILITELEVSGADVESLRKELEDSMLVIEEWKRKCDDMQEKMNYLEAGKNSIAEGLQHLQDENRLLVEQAEQKEEMVKNLKQELDNTISVFEAKLEEQATLVATKEKEIASLKDVIKTKEKDLTDKYAQLQNEMIQIDSLQDELIQRKSDLQQKDAAIVSLTEEVNELKVSYKKDVSSAKKEIENLQGQLKLSKSPEEFKELLRELENKDQLLNQLEATLHNYESEISSLQAQIKNAGVRNKELENELHKKSQELDDVKITSDQIEEKLKDAEIAKSEGKKRIEYVQNMLDTNAKYAEDLKVELNEAYQALEKLKVKHMEDMEMQNRRLEDIIEDLHSKIQESEALKSELERMQLLIGQNFTEETKKSLEVQITNLEQQLAESDEKSQRQLEKMKKIAVNLKKKAALVEELETKVNQLEEKLILEKDEKEAKNREIQEKDAALQEKDNQISSLEERFLGVQNEKQEALFHIERLSFELDESRQRLDSLTRLVLEMGEESFESMIEKCRIQQQDLEEAKDNVRELSVRMQVMETEYVDQLSTIQNLKTENGMLMSRQSQINERLENAEKESEDRRILLEQLKMEAEKKEAELAANKEAESVVKVEEAPKESAQDGTNTQCGRCDQCQTLVHTLEARLQERDAEIENLDNELANSIGNFVQMQENLRFNMNQSGQNRSLQEPYNELMVQYNALTASNEEIKKKLDETLKENQELTDKIESLKDLNVTLKERTEAVEQELSSGKTTTESLGAELETTRQELIAARSQTQELVVSRDRLSEELTICQQKISELELELSNLRESVSLEIPNRDLESSEPAPLFDASKAFGFVPVKDSDKQEIIKLSDLLSEKDNLCSSLSAEIERLKAENEAKVQSLLFEKQEIESSHELCRFQILQLENEIKSSNEAGRVRELEDRSIKIQRENDLLQLQVNDLTRALEDLKEAGAKTRNLQDELAAALGEKAQLLLQVENLTQSLRNLEQSKTVVEEKVEKATDPLKESTWATEMEKVEVEEEGWGWNAEEATLADDLVTNPLGATAEVQLQIRISELEDQLKDLEDDKAKILEDNRNVQTKCGKLIKKLKEYKFQVESLQQQVKSKKLTSDLCNLDSVFKDEMNSQISSLEKALGEAKEDNKKAIAEKENLLKRLDVLMAANERHLELKERQDMQLEVWEIRNKELTNRLGALQQKLEECGTEAQNSQVQSQTSQLEVKECLTAGDKSREELENLKIALEDLAAENDELQHLLEEQRTNRLAMESKMAVRSDTESRLEESNIRNVELQKDLDKLREEYNILRKQYEQSLMDANDQVQVMRQNSDVLKEELARKCEEIAEVLSLNKEADESLSRLSQELQEALREKEELRKALEKKVLEVQSLRQESDVCVESLKGEEMEIENLRKTILEKDEELLILKKRTEELVSSNSELEVRFQQMDLSLQTYLVDLETKNRILETKDQEIQTLVSTLQSHEINLQLLQNRVSQAEHELHESRNLLAERESTIQGFEQELQKAKQDLETSRLEIEELVSKLQVHEQELERLGEIEENKTESYNVLNLEFHAKKEELNYMKQRLSESETTITDLKEKLEKEVSSEAPKTVDGIPVFRMGGSDDQEIDELKSELSKKQLQIENLESSLSDSPYPQIIQELQDTVNRLYNEKAQIELTLATLSQNLRDRLKEKEEEVENLRQELELQRQQMDSDRVSRRKRSLGDDEINRLKDALRAWEQEVDDLRHVIAEKDAQLQQDSSSTEKETIERLMAEKEQVRLEAEEILERKLSEKEMEIESLKSRLQEEKELLLTDLKLKEKDIENLRIQFEGISSDHEEQLQKKMVEVAHAGNDLAEKDRRLAELSITKDAEIHNLNVQIHDRDVRIEELLALSEEEERQLSDLKRILETREQEITDLKQQLEEKVKELELIQHALKRHIMKSDDDDETSPSKGNSANELDLALYMLHQRDVRCEELTLELMQLLEERDTLQLRLSNAIRVNEELRRNGSPVKGLSSSSEDLPTVEDPSPSRAEGPVEIAKDALDSSIGENREALAQKLSQLHTVGHTKDVRLRDEREMRHTQQMNLLAHRDVLSTLPPEAAARYVNANYTLSRDVQSQSSVLMNWLWGKSTPKVMHM